MPQKHTNPEIISITTKMKTTPKPKHHDDTIEIEKLLDLITSRFKIEEALPQGKDLILGKNKMTVLPDGSEYPSWIMDPLNPDGSDLSALQKLIPNYIKKLKHTGDLETPAPTKEEFKLVSENLGWVPFIWIKHPNDLLNAKMKIKTKIIKHIEEQFKSSHLTCYNNDLIPSIHFNENKRIMKTDAVEIFKKYTRHIEKNSIPDEIYVPSENTPKKEEGWNFLCKKDYNYGSELRIALAHFHKKDPITPPSVDDVIEFFKSQKHLRINVIKSEFEITTDSGPQLVKRSNLKRAINRRIENWKKSIKDINNPPQNPKNHKL